MSGSLFLGIDVGTSAVKVVLVSPLGDVAASATTPLALSTPRPGWTEQDPSDWWQACLTSIRTVTEGRSPAQIAGIGISGQMHTAVFLDRAGRVIRPAVLWNDGRATAECREITSRAGGERQLAAWTCNPALEGFTLPKVVWLRNHEPAAFDRLATILLPKDYLRYCLTGVLGTEPSDASGTLMFDPARGRWSPELLDAMELEPELLPEVGGSAEILGAVTPDAARATGLVAGTPVVGGGADNACGAAAVGVVAPGEAVASWGTSGTVLVPTATPLMDPGLRVHTFCHVMPGVWYLMGVVLSAGGAFAWYRDHVVKVGQDVPTANRQLNLDASCVAPGADGITFLPYLAGERTPHRDAAARGAFTGLTLAHTQAHLTRAVLEGICFALRDCLGVLAELGVAPRQLLATGGGASSPFIRQLQSDVLGVPVGTVNREEGPAYGAALLAAVGTGAFDNLAAARATLVRGALVHPSEGASGQYAVPYRRFRSLYAALRTVYGSSE